MWDLINDVEELVYELECAVDNLAAVHGVMEEEGGVNWQRRCNALFSTYLQMYAIRESLQERLSQAAEACRLEGKRTE